MSDKIIHLTDDSFDTDVLKADGLTLVDFWAEWCGPCKMIAPILDEIAEEYQGKLTIAKLNIDQNPGTAPKYGIRGIPTLLLFKNICRSKPFPCAFAARKAEVLAEYNFFTAQY